MEHNANLAHILHTCVNWEDYAKCEGIIENREQMFGQRHVGQYEHLFVKIRRREIRG